MSRSISEVKWDLERVIREGYYYISVLIKQDVLISESPHATFRGSTVYINFITMNDLDSCNPQLLPSQMPVWFNIISWHDVLIVVVHTISVPSHFQLSHFQLSSASFRLLNTQQSAKNLAKVVSAFSLGRSSANFHTWS